MNEKHSNHGVTRRAILVLLPVNVLIPFILNIVREQMTGLFNTNLDLTIPRRLLFSIRPDSYAITFLFALIVFAIVIIMLRPLFRYLKGEGNYEKARSAAIKIPRFLIIFHVAFWLVGVTLIYGLLYKWDSPGGVPFIWSFVIAGGTGLITGVLTSLAVNTVLLDLKNMLFITTIEEGEKDLFVTVKDYLILGSALINIAVFLVYAAKFYIDAQVPPATHPSFPFMAFCVGLFFSVIFFVMLYLSRRERKYQTRLLSSRIGEISRSGGDLTQQIGLINFDDIGEISVQFNMLIDSFGEIVSALKKRSANLALGAETLSEQMRRSSEHIGTITGKLKNSSSILSGQQRNQEEAMSSIEEISRTVASLERQIADQAASVTQSSAAIEEMVANIRSVTQTVQKVSERFDQLLRVSTSGREKINYVVENIRAVEEQSANLEEANKLISSIAAQTNLLSMNAAIEAAHAGAVGKGFAVVADEIRTLASVSQTHSKTIKEELQKTQEVIRAVVTSATDAQSVFSDIDHYIQEVDALEDEIKNSMEEQSTGSIQVLQALQQIKDITAAVETGSGEMGQGIGLLRKEMETVTANSRDITDNMDSILDNTVQISQSIGTIEELSEENRANIGSLTAAANQFKVKSGD